MRTPGLPLRILLALALVLNGIGGAMAGVLAAVPALPAPVEAHAEAEAATDASGHCHEQSGGATVAAKAPAPVAHPTDCHSGGDVPCGDSAECLQACLHASVAMPSQPLAAIAGTAAEAVLHPLACGHPAPLLRSPIRPPIA